MAQAVPANGLKRTMGYYYLVAYCPSEHIGDLKKAAQSLREGVAKEADMTLTDYFSQATPEVCRRVVAFHQNSREPDEEIVAALAEKAMSADRGRVKAEAFQEEMVKVAALPQRARPENRLHRRRGCQFCAAPCRYGYFTLISDPDFSILRGLLEMETRRPVAEQNPLGLVWSFAMGHLARTLEGPTGFISADHLGNLAYCLLTLGAAKSRLPLPERQLRAFQVGNQRLIRGWRTALVR
jgi:hypothetical protein